MEERVKGAVVNAARGAGCYLRDSVSGRKSPYEHEKRARDIMVRELRSKMPQLSLWGEDERQERGFAICPLDTRMNFERGIGRYGAMAAYVERGDLLFGAIFLPDIDEMITAEAGKGARLDGRRIGANGREGLSKAVVCCGCDIYSEDLRPMGIGVIEALSRNAIAWRNMGSPAAEFAYLSLGMVDGFVTPMLETAHAAGYLAMREAGAVVTDAEGRPFTLRSGAIIAAGPRLHPDLFELVRDSL